MPEKSSQIINVADDFGISEVANRNILKLVEKGKVDRVSVLINYNPEVLKPDEIKLLQEANIKIDLHLDYQIFFFKKKSRQLKESPLPRLLNFCLGYLVGKSRVSLVEKEWEDQMQKFIEVFGKAPDGINSHQYIHLFPSYFRVVLKLSQKYNIPYIRYGKSGILKNWNVVSRILFSLRKMTQRDFTENRCQSSDFLVSLDWINNVGNFIQTLPQGTTEIVCHPERNEEFQTMMKYF